LLDFNILYFQSIGKGISHYNDLFQITIHSQWIEIFLLFIGIFILSGWPNKINEFISSTLPSPVLTDNTGINSSREIDQNNVAIYKSDYYSLIAIFSILGGSLLMSSLDLLSMYLSIELQSFALYVLATLNKDKLNSTAAGLKYFLLGSLSSCFILLGSAVIYSYSGLTHLESLHSLISIPSVPSLYSEYGLEAFKGGIGNDSMIPTMIDANNLWFEIKTPFTIGIVIIIIGFLFKLSAAPFYQWAPDVYDATPTIVTVWLTIVAKLTIFIFIQNFVDFSIPSFTSLSLTYLSPSINSSLLTEPGWSVLSWSSLSFSVEGIKDETGYIIKNLLLISSLLSLIIGTVAGLSQIKIKRLLSFSSVSHVGFLLLALGIYTPKSMESFFFYLIQYSITSLNIFLVFLALGYIVNTHKLNLIFKYKVSSQGEGYENSIKDKETDLNYLSELRGQFTNNTILSISLAICLFSMAGIPPLIGFFSKQFVLFSAIENGNYFLSVVAILVSVISASYYLKLIKLTFFEDKGIISSKVTSLSAKVMNSLHPISSSHSVSSTSIKWEGQNEGIYLEISSIHSFIISILTLLILFFFVNTSILLKVTSLFSITLFNL
jgi:NADH-ubiquinone oxidoreductase chain 2